MKQIIKASFILVLIDQIIKALVANYIKENDAIEIIDNFFYLTNLKNGGAAFNIFQGKTIFLIALGIVGVSFIFFLIKDEEELRKIHIVSYSLLLSGVIGNLLDRMINGEVLDYLYFKLLNFPIFNFSDICIVIGVIIFSYEMLRSDIYAKDNSNEKGETRQISSGKPRGNKNKNTSTNKRGKNSSKPKQSKK